MRFLIFSIFLCLPLSGFGQQQPDFNLSLVSNIGIEFPDSVPRVYRNYNDIWGWESDDRAYAIIGCGYGSAIFDVTVPESPVLASFIPGDLSRWRDFKSHGNYLYITADEGDDGLTIVNMSEAPDNITYQQFQPVVSVRPDLSGPLGRCHNLYIDNGYVFLSGCNINLNNRTGVLIFDLNEDPENPTYIANTGANAVYSHDVFVRDNLLFSSDFFEGKVNIWDISDIANPVIMAAAETGSSRTHNAWTSDDNQYLFTTDETSFGLVESYDISNLDDIRFLDAYAPPLTFDLGVIPHNVHYHEGYLVTSYYTDGIKILDAGRPQNLVEVASFDSYLFADGGFSGVWGAYPFTQSGLVYASDRSSGLWILNPDYQRAAYVEGTITDQFGNPLSDIKVAIQTDKGGKTSSLSDGTYEIGAAASGPHEIIFNNCENNCGQSQGNYKKVVTQVDLVPGEVVELNVVLNLRQDRTISGGVRDADSGAPISDAHIVALSGSNSAETRTAADGSYSMVVLEDEYEIVCGQWGWKPEGVNTEVSANLNLDFGLQVGYQDDFATDQGWQVDTGIINRTGIDEWELGIPVGARYDTVFANPPADLPNDLGQGCYVTGLDLFLTGNLIGSSILTSPVFDGTRYEDPYVNYSLWFYSNGVLPADDSLKVFLLNGSDEVLIEELTESASGWRPRSEIRIQDHIDLTSQMQFRVVAVDTGNVHIYDAGLDGFSISEGPLTYDQQYELALRVAPNPVSDILYLRSEEPLRWRLHDILGHKLLTQFNWTSNDEIDLRHLTPGTYFLIAENAMGHWINKKIIKY